MSYNKNIWKRKDRITKEKLNHMEDGIYTAHDEINVINNKVEENRTDTNTARQDINDIKLQIGTEELTTTSKKIKGAINDLSSQIKEIKNNFFYDKLTKIQENWNLADMSWNKNFSTRYMLDKKLKLSELCLDYDLINIEGNKGLPYKVDGNHTITVSGKKLTSMNNESTKSTSVISVGKLEPFSTIEGTFTDLPIIEGDYCGLHIYVKKIMFIFKIIKINSGYSLRILHWDNMNNTAILPDTDILSLPNINTNDKIKLIISTNNGGNMDLYYEINNSEPIFVYTYSYNDPLWGGNLRKVGSHPNYKIEFRLSKNGFSSCIGCSSYYDSGVGQHNMALIKYENGQPILKDGKVFFNMGVATQNSASESIYSMVLSTCEIKMEGKIFLDMDKNGYYASSSASHIMYDRNTNQWIIYCRTNDHCVGVGAVYSPLLEGIHLIQVDTFEFSGGTHITNGIESEDNDEDPLCYYDENDKLYHLYICRLHDVNGEDKYQYVEYTSNNPVTGFTLSGRTTGDIGNLTAASVTKVNNQNYLVTGDERSADSDIYRAFPLPLSDNAITIKLDDNGYRGGGCLFPIPFGSYTKYLWLTFDRQLSQNKDYLWNYGNLYCYEADKINVGYEYPIKYKFI